MHSRRRAPKRALPGRRACWPVGLGCMRGVCAQLASAPWSRRLLPGVTLPCSGCAAQAPVCWLALGTALYSSALQSCCRTAEQSSIWSPALLLGSRPEALSLHEPPIPCGAWSACWGLLRTPAAVLAGECSHASGTVKALPLPPGQCLHTPEGVAGAQPAEGLDIGEGGVARALRVRRATWLCSAARRASHFRAWPCASPLHASQSLRPTA